MMIETIVIKQGVVEFAVKTISWLKIGDLKFVGNFDAKCIYASVSKKKIICWFGKCRMDKEFLERNATNKCCLFRKNYLDSFFHFVEGSISLNLPSCLRKKNPCFLSIVLLS